MVFEYVKDVSRLCIRQWMARTLKLKKRCKGKDAIMSLTPSRIEKADGEELLIKYVIIT